MTYRPISFGVLQPSIMSLQSSVMYFVSTYLSHAISHCTSLITV